MQKFRKLIAGLNCRVQSTRLYGKPLQHLDVENRLTILEHIITALRLSPVISDIVLGIAEGAENTPFVKIAEQYDLAYIWGNEIDGLGRLIACGRKLAATDLFRMTTENPFPYLEGIPAAWEQHISDNLDVTVCDQLPDGCGFQIFRLKALEISHIEGEASDRVQDVGHFIRRHQSRFNIGIVPVPDHLRRMDLRLTVDYPEDLYVCREIYRQFRVDSPKISVERIIRFFDRRSELKGLVSAHTPFVSLWH